MYHGWSDPGISAAGTVPGMHHCGGGPGPNTFDMLPMLEAWVEEGIVPPLPASAGGAL